MSSSKTVVVVTGCSKGGIGFSLCEEFASRGCTVYATARKVEKMEGFKYDGIRKLAVDVTSDEQVQKAVAEIIREEGRIDIIINNAGLLCIGPAVDIPLEEVKRVFDTNVFGMLRTAHAVLPHMANRKQGLIVNVTSVVGECPTPWAGIYCASKAAANSITEVLQMECKPFNVKVMLLAPGSVKSQISDNNSSSFRLLPDSLYTNYMEHIRRRLWLSQTMHPMSSEEFARKAADNILSTTPPRYLILGGNWMMVTLGKMLPRSIYLWYSWKIFSKP